MKSAVSVPAATSAGYMRGVSVSYENFKHTSVPHTYTWRMCSELPRGHLKPRTVLDPVHTVPALHVQVLEKHDKIAGAFFFLRASWIEGILMPRIIVTWAYNSGFPYRELLPLCLWESFCRFPWHIQAISWTLEPLLRKINVNLRTGTVKPLQLLW